MLEIYDFFIQFLGIISIIGIVATGFVLVKNDPSSDHSSISSYAGSTSAQARLGFLALIILSIPFYAWMISWLIPEYQLPTLLYPFVLLSFLCHILLILFPLVPEKGRRHIGNLLHLGAGSVIAFSMLGLLIALSFSAEINEHMISQAILFVTIAYMILCLLSYVLVRNKKYFFEFEVLYILLFAICVGVLTLKI